MSTQFEEAEIASYAPNTGPTNEDQVKSDSAVRWFFNPAARIDVRDRVTGNEINEEGKSGHRQFIKAGTLVPFRNVTYNIPRPKDQPPMPGLSPQQQRFVTLTKYASAVADEIAFAYADTGARVVDSLTGIEDEKLVRTIYRLCVGPKIKIATDPMLPGQKIPVLPAMLEYLTREAPQTIEKAFEGQNDPKLKAIVERTRLILTAACNDAVSGWATATTRESRKSIADRAGGHPGRSEFDDRDRRMFAALGETIPTDIQATDPTMAKAVELLLKKELAKSEAPAEPVEDPRIAMLEKALAEQTAQIQRLTARMNKKALPEKAEQANAGT